MWLGHSKEKVAWVKAEKNFSYPKCGKLALSQLKNSWLTKVCQWRIHKSFFWCKNYSESREKNVSRNQKIRPLRVSTGIIDEMGIFNKINKLIEENHTEKITAGKEVCSSLKTPCFQLIVPF